MNDDDKYGLPLWITRSKIFANRHLFHKIVLTILIYLSFAIGMLCILGLAMWLYSIFTEGWHNFMHGYLGSGYFGVGSYPPSFKALRLPIAVTLFVLIGAAIFLYRKYKVIWINWGLGVIIVTAGTLLFHQNQKNVYRYNQNMEYAMLKNQAKVCDNLPHLTLPSDFPLENKNEYCDEVYQKFKAFKNTKYWKSYCKKGIDC